ncbi:5-carboxymethyl-2-hydroxymuconate Delta-isomerase [Rhizobium sp. CF080]|uniref:fumarylacetoacetate hydrolase family protein n=1 Tax=Rhizobium sp. (strain CF080) TaxID=1144310 RepID=UPI0002718059|nr:fumarylacetoacetate hydrolase family protein [Rhizobium sp. CF080]EUB99182.1 5-carboxymethyl-2-hydroxymuconate Delta-isomerase [Rhizobium sp. CF080]
MTYPRFASFSGPRGDGYGLVTDKGIVDLAGRYRDRWATLKDVVADGALTRLAGEAGGLGEDFGLGDVRFAIPIRTPEKIICVGVNFPDRNEEYKDGKAASSYPSLFPRFPGSFTGHGQPLIRPPESAQLDYEGEIAIVIGKSGRRIPEASALDHVAAITLANEGTIRDWTRHGKFNVTQGKNFDRSGSIGPWLVPFTDEAQLADIHLETRVNGELRQEDRTSRMTFSFRHILAYISTFTTLVPGDVIITGTPTGAGARFDPPRWLKPGDVIEVEADGIGILRNTVADEA